MTYLLLTPHPSIAMTYLLLSHHPWVDGDDLLYLLLTHHPRVDGDDQEDAEDDGQHRGGHVVHDGPATNLEINKVDFV